MNDDGFMTTEEVLQYLQLNLRTVYRLVNAGQIPAVRVGRQWRFRRRDIDAWLATTAKTTAPVAPTGRASVLVVDDDRAARDVLASTLKVTTKYDVETAPDGPTALAMVQARHFDVVLTDLKMPTMDGLTFVEELRRIHPGMPVVILTAASTERAAITAANLGVSGYLLKPYEWPQILEAVARALTK